MKKIFPRISPFHRDCPTSLGRFPFRLPSANITKLFSSNRTRIIRRFYHFTLVHPEIEKVPFSPFFFYLFARNKSPDRKRFWRAQVFSRLPDSASFIPVSPRTEMRIPFFRSGSLEKLRCPVVSYSCPLKTSPIFLSLSFTFSFAPP